VRRFSRIFNARAKAAEIVDNNKTTSKKISQFYPKNPYLVLAND
jgi:hypothetical protein